MQGTAPVELGSISDRSAALRQQSGQVLRLPSLDVMRAVALLLVMGRHLHVTDTWSRLGWLGVQLFFVLSGFLVSGLLFREFQAHGSLDVRRFLIRRAFKIYPSFWMLLLVTIPLAHLTSAPPRAAQLISEVFFLQSYLPGYWEHTWSLAVEEHFYLLLALGLPALLRRKLPGDPFALIPRIALTICAICLAGRIATVLWLPFQHQTHIFPTHLRLDALGFGVGLSYWVHFHREGWARFMKQHSLWLWLLALACLTPLSWMEITQSDFVLTFGMTLGYIGLGALLLVGLHSRSRLPVRLPGIAHGIESAMVWLGQNSYNIYLWHMVLALWGIGKIKTSFAPGMAYSTQLWIYFLGSILLGAAATQVIERPLLKLRDHWYPSRNAPERVGNCRTNA